jgi:hypothetical protein
MYQAALACKLSSALARKNVRSLLAWFTLRAQRWRSYVRPKH